LLDKELRSRTLQANQLYKQFEQAILQYQSIISSSCEEFNNNKTSTNHHNDSQVMECTSDRQSFLPDIQAPSATSATVLSKSPLGISSDTMTTPIASPYASPQLDTSTIEASTLVCVDTPLENDKISQMASSMARPLMIMEDKSSSTSTTLPNNDTIVGGSPTIKSNSNIEKTMKDKLSSSTSSTLPNDDATVVGSPTTKSSSGIEKTIVTSAREEAYRIDKEHKKAERLVQKTKHAIRRLRQDFQHQLRELDRLERRLYTITYAYELTQKQNLTAYLEEEKSEVVKFMEYNTTTTNDNDDDDSDVLLEKSTKRSFLSLIDAADNHHFNEFNDDNYATSSNKRARFTSNVLRLSLWVVVATAPTILWATINNLNVYTSCLDYFSTLFY
jgi:hypothetical protein